MKEFIFEEFQYNYARFLYDRIDVDTSFVG